MSLSELLSPRELLSFCSVFDELQSMKYTVCHPKSVGLCSNSIIEIKMFTIWSKIQASLNRIPSKDGENKNQINDAFLLTRILCAIIIKV